MKTLIGVVAFALPISGHGETAYQQKISRLQERYMTLEAKVSAEGKLSLADAEERLNIMGQLTAEDPVWVLMSRLEGDIQALNVTSEKKEGDELLLDEQKTFLALLVGKASAMTSLVEANTFSAQVRQCLLRRDLAGMRALAKRH